MVFTSSIIGFNRTVIAIIEFDKLPIKEFVKTIYRSSKDVFNVLRINVKTIYSIIG